MQAIDKEDLEQLRLDVERILIRLNAMPSIEVLVGIPFYDEDDTIAGVVDTARKGLQQLGLTGKSVILCVGPHEHERRLKKALKHRSRNKIPAYGFGHNHGIEGYGWGLRTIIDVAARRGASLLIMRPNIKPQNGNEAGKGMAPFWISDLLRPVREMGQGLALANFVRHPFSHPVDSLITYPLFAEIFCLRLRQPTPGVLALSPKFTQICSSSASSWPRECGVYGFDSWILTRALRSDQTICEVPLGLVSFQHETKRLKLKFYQIVHTLMLEVDMHEDWWLEQPNVTEFPSRVGELEMELTPPVIEIDPGNLFRRFKKEFNHFDDTLFREVLPGNFRRRLERLSESGSNGVSLDAEEWRDVVNRFTLAYHFEPGFHPDDIVDGLFPLYLLRLLGLIDEVQSLHDMVPEAAQRRKNDVRTFMFNHAEQIIQTDTNLFISERESFRNRWQAETQKISPYLPRLGAWEFVPQVGIIVPQELEKPDGGTVWASEVYKDILDRYRREFMAFLSTSLGLSQLTDSSLILRAVHEFMLKLERALGSVFPYDLTTVEGARKMTQCVYDRFKRRPVLQLTAHGAQHLLTHTPPNELILHLHYRNVGTLLAQADPCDVLAIASWTEQRNFLEKILDMLEESGESDWFHMAPLEPAIVSIDLLADPTEMRGVRALARLAGRLLAGNLPKGWGGEYPRLWFLLQLVHDIVVAESYAEIWEQYSSNRIDFNERIVQSIRGHWGRYVTSGHHVFKNRHQRNIVERLQLFAKQIEREGKKAQTAAQLLEAACGVYHISITLPDNTFVPLSMWTWTSYSYRGGLGSPTPLSSLVERDWATTDFLTEYITRAKLGDEATVYRKLIERIGEGKEFEDISTALFEVPKETQSLIIRQSMASRPLPAQKLKRPLGRAILEPNPESDWENRYVLNAGVVRLDGTVYILYRAFGTDKISRIGLAWTRDGIHLDGRLDEPIFAPAVATESMGCEDPRITIIGDRLYMLYTAFDGRVPQIAMASIPVEAFLERRFDCWKRHGHGFPGLSNKDAVLYPEKFNGHYVIYHRLDPNLWVSYLDDLTCPWPRTGQKIVAGPRPGMMWDGVKIGAGAQPIKTTTGWLNIYHGVDYERCYRLGTLFMPLDDPARILYRSPNAILEPELDYELGNLEGRDYWMPRVVFTCGAVPREDKDVVGLDDEILVYYGAADTAIGVATGTLRDMVPSLEHDSMNRK